MPSSRREFVQVAAALSGVASFPAFLRQRQRVAPLRVGVIGCGGRGTGAARDCLRADPGTELVALGDLFPDRLASCRSNLAQVAAEDASIAPRIKVEDSRCFTGFDAYQRVLETDVDLVILATPPGFRPAHLAAAVSAGKHVFTEKPVAVDPAGIRSVVGSAAEAKRRSLAIVAGTQRRHDPAYREIIGRIHSGAIGQVIAGQVYWNQGGLWMHPRRPEWSDTEWQLRNWLYFTWLSGDHIVEQHMHNLDVANWVLQAHPVKAVGVGGRQQRTDPAYGHVYDHFAVDYEYPSGARVTSISRQIDGSASYVGEHFLGSAGRSDARTFIEGPAPFRYQPPTPAVNPYVQEHANLVASIRAGTPLNEGQQVAEATLTAIMGREAAYTGQTITWEEAWNATQDLTPASIQFGSLPVPPVAMPGRTKLNRSREG